MPPVIGCAESGFRIKRAAAALTAGGLVAYPTEAVYGLGCDPLDYDAVRRLLIAKHRPVQKGLILIAADFEQLEPFVESPTGDVYDKALSTWPGPVTWVMPARKNVPVWLRGDHAGIAVRVTAHPVAAELCRAFGGAIVSTSANLAGQPPARTALQARLRTGKVLDFVVSGKTSGLAAPTPIFNVTDGSPLRLP